MPLSRRDMILAGASAIGVGSRAAFSAETCGQLVPMESIDGPPEYLYGAPMRTSLLEGGESGQRVRITGRAFTTRCEPLAGARLDFWHTDAAGKYDMAGHKFRGTQLTDVQGRYHLESMMPGRYNGVPHFHLLLATRLGGRPQPLMVPGVIYFPTREEYAKASDQQRIPEFLNPEAHRTIDGVLVATCDIILEVA